MIQRSQPAKRFWSKGLGSLCRKCVFWLAACTCGFGEERSYELGRAFRHRVRQDELSLRRQNEYKSRCDEWKRPSRHQGREEVGTVCILYCAFKDSLAAARADQKLMRVPIGGGTASQLVPTGGQFDEFRCSTKPQERCVLRTIENRHHVYRELDAVQGPGQELHERPGHPPYLAIGRSLPMVPMRRCRSMTRDRRESFSSGWVSTRHSSSDKK
jgi:hypothetical protein